jgi:DNA-binding response OmpR family regulator
LGSARILLVESDPDLRDALGDQLDRVEGFATHRAALAQQALDHARDHPQSLDLVLLDNALPDLDGPAACLALRGLGLRCPIILLASQDSDAQTILGLDAGANDYIAKPLRFGVLLARIRAQLRAFSQDDPQLKPLGRFQFNVVERVLIDPKGASLRLTGKECAILKYLYQANGTSVTREVLLQEVWGYAAAISTHTLETHIYRLRRKIEDDPARASLLVTDAGGYKLVR